MPEAVAQLLSDKLKEVANHTRQFSKKKRLQSNDISENSYSSLSQEISELSKDTCAEENLSLQEQPENDTIVIDVVESKSDTSRLMQSNDNKSSSTISDSSLDFSQTVSCQLTLEKIEEIAANVPELYNEEQITFLNQDNSSEPKQNQSSLIEQNNHTEESRTNESDPAASSKLETSTTDFSSQRHNEQNNKRASPQLSPSPSSITTTTTTTDITTTSTTMMTTKTTIAPYVSILMHLKKPR